MSLERVFEAVDGVKRAGSVDAAFGEPQQVEGKVLIPVAVTGVGYGLGFEGGEDKETTANAGGGGGGRTRPVAVIEVTPESTTVRPIVDETRVFLAAIALVGWVVFWVAATVHSVFGGYHRPYGQVSDLDLERQ